MLPIVQLRRVTRDDVQRIAEWLSDDAVSSRWFGHYACGDPVHRGYEPGLMLGATAEDWVRVFDHDRHRLIFSIYAGDEGHIGECQAVFDERNDVEISLLIGRKELWHRGFGASAAIQLLDRIFYDFPADHAWVSVPENNVAALRLFNRLGFSYVTDQVLCQTPGGGELRTAILSLPASDYQDRKLEPRSARKIVSPIVTVTGPPGSGREHVAAETARLLRANLLDEEITAEVAKVLDRTPGEIESLEASYTSLWARLLRASLEPWERYGVLEASPEMFGAYPVAADQFEPPDYLTREEYMRGLGSVFSSASTDSSLVIHGHGAVALTPQGRPVFHVLVEMSMDGRVHKAQFEDRVSEPYAQRMLKRSDKAFVSQYKGLYGVDPTDPAKYDIVINMDRLSVESAARIVSGAVARSVRSYRRSRPELQPA